MANGQIQTLVDQLREIVVQEVSEAAIIERVRPLVSAPMEF